MKSVGDAVRRVAPGAIVTAEYPELVLAAFLLRPSARPLERPEVLDASNVATSGAPLGIPDSCLYSNLSLIGKPLECGEWGVVIYPASTRVTSAGSEEIGDINHLNQNCHMFGLGAVQSREWDWRDSYSVATRIETGAWCTARTK